MKEKFLAFATQTKQWLVEHPRAALLIAGFLMGLFVGLFLF